MRARVAVALAVGVCALALMGVGSASATVLCKENFPECPAGSKYPIGTEIVAKLKKETAWELEAGFATIKCNESEIVAKTFNLGSPVERVGATVTKESFAGCAAGQEVVVNELGLIEFGWAGGGNGIVIAKGGSISVSTKLAKCVYGGTVAGEPYDLIGGGAASLVATFATTELTKIGGGALCASPAPLDAEYEVTKPVTLSVVEK